LPLRWKIFLRQGLPHLQATHSAIIRDLAVGHLVQTRGVGGRAFATLWNFSDGSSVCIYERPRGKSPYAGIIRKSREGTTVDRVKSLLVTMRLSTVAVLAVALLVIGAACGSDEASTVPAKATSPLAVLGAPVDESGMPLGPKRELVTPAPSVSDPRQPVQISGPSRGLADSIDAAIIDLANVWASTHPAA